MNTIEANQMIIYGNGRIEIGPSLGFDETTRRRVARYLRPVVSRLTAFAKQNPECGFIGDRPCGWCFLTKIPKDEFNAILAEVLSMIEDIVAIEAKRQASLGSSRLRNGSRLT